LAYSPTLKMDAISSSEYSVFLENTIFYNTQDRTLHGYIMITSNPASFPFSNKQCTSKEDFGNFMRLLLCEEADKSSAL
jgi:hypothetical protein